MDQWDPKHVELTYVMNKTQSLKNFVYLVGLHIYLNYLSPGLRNKFRMLKIKPRNLHTYAEPTVTWLSVSLADSGLSSETQ